MAIITTLCGSTKYKNEFDQVNTYLTLKGHIVLSVGFFEQTEGVALTKDQIQLFERLHFEKIDLAHQIFVINPGGYIGESTRREIEYAKKRNTPIHYYSDEYEDIIKTIESLKGKTTK